MAECQLPFGMMFSLPLKISIGVITAFAGALGNIPPGWYLCNGTNGTPDLREKFVVGAGVAFAVGDEGGTVSHVHDLTSNGHTHTIPGGFGTDPGSDFKSTTGSQVESATTDSGNTRPPFYALAYIQYLGA